VKRSVLGLKLILRFCVQHLFQTCFAPVNIQSVSHDTSADTHVGFNANRPLLLSDFNQNCNVRENISKTF